MYLLNVTNRSYTFNVLHIFLYYMHFSIFELLYKCIMFDYEYCGILQEEDISHSRVNVLIGKLHLENAILLRLFTVLPVTDERNTRNTRNIRVHASMTRCAVARGASLTEKSAKFPSLANVNRLLLGPFFHAFLLHAFSRSFSTVPFLRAL